MFDEDLIQNYLPNPAKCIAHSLNCNTCIEGCESTCTEWRILQEPESIVKATHQWSGLPLLGNKSG